MENLAISFVFYSSTETNRAAVTVWRRALPSSMQRLRQVDDTSGRDARGSTRSGFRPCIVAGPISRSVLANASALPRKPRKMPAGSAHCIDTVLTMSWARVRVHWQARLLIRIYQRRWPSLEWWGLA